MFGISLGEIFLVFLIGILVLKPGDIKSIYIQIRDWITMINNETDNIKNVFQKIANDEIDDKKIYNVKDAILFDVSKNNNNLK